MLLSQPNFRDLGGIVALDGCRVRTGMIFRSGDLSRLTDEDLGKLETLGLKMIIDFRAQREITKHPDRVPATIREQLTIHIHDAARDLAEKRFAENDGLALESVLTDDYVRMVRYHQPEFRRFLGVLSETEDMPVVFHCAAGKDRTGLAAVFLLFALGVGMEEIWEDYLETNRRVAGVVEHIVTKVNESGQNGEILRPLLLVRSEYLGAALETIDREYGGMENYVMKVLKADRERLREKFMET